MESPDQKRSFFDFIARDQRKLSPDLESLATDLVDAMVEVHRQLDPGHPERIYENAMCRDLELRDISYQRQVRVRVHYKGVDVGDSIVDILVDRRIVLELKAVDALSPTHRAQLGSYLIALNAELGFLANFNVAMMKDGIKRVIRTRANKDFSPH